MKSKLISACEQNDIDEIHRLLKNKNIDIYKIKNGKCAIELAIENENNEILKALKFIFHINIYIIYVLMIILRV
jgi:ankyrin repeat protein